MTVTSSFCSKLRRTDRACGSQWLCLPLLLAVNTGWTADFCVTNEKELQEALDEAVANNQDNRILVAQGTYAGAFSYDFFRSSPQEAPESRSLQVLGGYVAGCGSRDLSPENTTLTATGETTLSFSAYSFTDDDLIPTPGADLLLEGFTVAGGTSEVGGGGINVTTGGSAVLRQVWMQGNSTQGLGGGASIIADAGVEVSNSRFSDNVAYSGGGLTAKSTGPLLLVLNLFQRNSASSVAGGAELQSDGDVILRDNSFLDNTDEGTELIGGGAYIVALNVTLTRNHFSGNNAGGLWLDATSATITENAFDGNSGFWFGGGAVVGTSGGPAKITGNSFTNNAGSSYAGGIFVTSTGGDLNFTRNQVSNNSGSLVGGAVIAVLDGNVVVASNFFSDNKGDEVGGVFAEEDSETTSSTSKIGNNSFIRNEGDSCGGMEVDLYKGNSAEIYNNLFWDNVGVRTDDLCIENDLDDDGRTPSVALSHNDFNQTQPGGFYAAEPVDIPMSNPNSLDPLLENDGLHLSETSPIIDAGGDFDLAATDIDGRIRVVGSGVDIGADEYDAAAPYYRQLQEVYIAYYGRPADPAGQYWWAEQLLSVGGDLTAIIQQFGTSSEFDESYGGLDNGELIDKVYLNMFGREPDAEGRAFYLSRLDAGTLTLQTIALDVLNGAQNEDFTIIDNKVQCSDYFTAEVLDRGLSYTSAHIPQAWDMLALVGVRSESVADCNAAADGILVQMDE